MAADVSRQIKNTAGDGKRGTGGGPITRDFLGGCFGIESKELDLDLHVPIGWEKRLDLKSGNVYIQRCNNPPPTTSPFGRRNNINVNQTPPNSSLTLHDFNFPPQPKPKQQPQPTTGNANLCLFEDTTNLDLKLVSASTVTTSPPSLAATAMMTNYQSLCTLEKVKSSLDRAWRDPPPSSAKKRPTPSTLSCSSSPPSSSDSPASSVMSAKGLDSAATLIDHTQQQGNGLLVAAACPCCLLYVLISKSNPKCPKCNSFIPSPVMPKKPKIDLNISI